MVKIVSQNLWTATTPEKHFQAEREPIFADFIAEYRPGSLGTQECEDFWRERLDTVLLGYRRAQETQKTKNYIWYDPEQLELLDSGVFWLSETPDKPSKGFGSRYWISCCFARYSERATGKSFVHMNTHLDVTDNSLRMNELTVLLPRVRSFCDEGLPVVLTGDFNARFDTPVYPQVLSAGLLDSRTAAKQTEDTGTFNNYDYEAPYRGIIDFCFITPDISAEKYSVVDKRGGLYMSDHNAVCTELVLLGST